MKNRFTAATEGSYEHPLAAIWILGSAITVSFRHEAEDHEMLWIDTRAIRQERGEAASGEAGGPQPWVVSTWEPMT